MSSSSSCNSGSVDNDNTGGDTRPTITKTNGEITKKKNSVDFAKTTVVGQTKWLRLESIRYNDANGIERPWDRCVRSTKQSETDADAVIILAILRYNKNNDNNNSSQQQQQDDQIVTVKQFRPPINSFTIELPAGLIDVNETPSEAALRELYEETGYVGSKVISVSPPTLLSPGLTNESVSVVKIDVDMNSKQNLNNNPQKNVQLDSSEESNSLQTILLPKIGLLSELNKLYTKDNLQIFGMLYTLALAMELE